MIRITIALDNDAGLALIRVSDFEKRDIRKQAALMVEEELISRGLLVKEQPKPVVSTSNSTPSDSPTNKSYQ